MNSSFIGNLQQSQQQMKDAEAYRALVRSAEDNSLARNAAAQTKAAYDNAEIGYGLTRAEIAQVTGRPTSEVSYDTLSDQQLQQLGFAKQQASRPQTPVERGPLSPEAAVNQVAMQQAAQEVGTGRLGLAGQLAGRSAPAVDNVALNAYVGGINKPTGGINQNADGGSIGNSIGEITDMLPRDDVQIRDAKRKGAH